MKIVFLAPFGIRPKGTLIARMLPLAAGLQNLGHKVVIIAPPYTNPEDAGVSELVNGVMLRNVQLGPGGKALSAIPVAWRMFRAAMAENADMIHLFKPKGYGGIAAMLMLCCKQCGFNIPPVFLDTDDWEGTGGMNELHSYSSLEKRVYSFQEGWLTTRVKGVTVASRALEQLVAQQGIAEKKRLYLPNCIDDLPPGNGAIMRSRLGIEADRPVLLLYTRFFEFSQARLHKLFAAIHQNLPEVRFLVIGAGRAGEEQLLTDAAHSGGFSDALILAGWTEPGQLPDLLAVGDLAIYPFDDTLVNRTKCPAKLTELLRGAIPVVGDRVGQIPEYLAPELQQFLCDPSDTDQMTATCLNLLRDRAKCQDLGRAGRRHLLEHFRWSDAARELDRFYNALIP